MTHDTTFFNHGILNGSFMHMYAARIQSQYSFRWRVHRAGNLVEREGAAVWFEKVKQKRCCSGTALEERQLVVTLRPMRRVIAHDAVIE